MHKRAYDINKEGLRVHLSSAKDFISEDYTNNRQS